MQRLAPWLLLPVLAACAEADGGLADSSEPAYPGLEGVVRSAMVEGPDGPERLHYEFLDGMAFVEGDILLGTEADLETTGPMFLGRSARVWPDQVVYYEIDAALEKPERVEQAIAHWRRVAPLDFVARTNQPRWIRFVPGSGCSSSVGLQTKQPQLVRLSDSCSVSNTIHEIGHAIGLWHEQSRPDRDEHIAIHWDCIREGKEHNFSVRDGTLLGPYDVGSRMHYGSTTFLDKSRTDPATGAPCAATITTAQGDKVPRVPRLSPHDIRGVELLYDVSWVPGFAGDVDGDGLTDLITIRQAPSTGRLRIRTDFHRGDGEWHTVVSRRTDGGEILQYPPLAGDVTGNGRTDLVFVFRDDKRLALRTLRSSGNGRWQRAQQSFGDGVGVHSGATLLADVNRDGKKDVVFVFHGASGLEVRTKMSRGDGTFASHRQVLGDGAWVGAAGAVAGDIDGDGRDDLVLVHRGEDGSRMVVTTLFSRGDGTFRRATTRLDLEPPVHAAPPLVADVSGNGRDDLVFAYVDAGDKQVRLVTLRSRGDGTYAARRTATGDGPATLAGHRFVGDVDGDGRADLVFVFASGGRTVIRTKFSSGDGTWGHRGRILPGDTRYLAYPTFAGDADGDGRLDLLLSWHDPDSQAHTVQVRRSRGDGTWQAFTAAPVPQE